MNLLQSDFLNFSFILISIGFAIVLPFELFLFSYAFLRPLHYLTEINWLQTRKYFSKSRFPIYFILTITVLISLLYLNAYFEIVAFSLAGKLVVSITTYFIMSSFLFVVFTELFKDKFQNFKYHLVLIFILSIALSVLILKNNYHAHIATFVFLPTLIHVYVFTLLFMWFGYVKNPSLFALLSLIIMVSIPMVTLIVPGPLFLEITSTVGLETYKDSGFTVINQSLTRYFGEGVDIGTNLYESALGLKIQSFIAFAYTYHYLNWFAKINIIGWAKSLSK